MAAVEPRELWYTHFGPAPGSREALQNYRRAVEDWREVALSAARIDPSVRTVAAALQQHESGASGTGEAASAPDPGALVSSYDLSAQGLLRYFRTQGLIPAEAP
jgi:DNA-binding LacI/PurR family transcriptional regulator